MSLKMFDDPRLDGIVFDAIIYALADRLVQEEIWTNTSWPEDEPVLTGKIMMNEHIEIIKEEAAMIKKMWL